MLINNILQLVKPVGAMWSPTEAVKDRTLQSYLAALAGLSFRSPVTEPTWGMIKLLVSTRNEHKVREIAAILGHHFEVSSLCTWVGAPTIVEDAPDFAGNALKKALGLAVWLAERRSEKTPDYVLADDSGLEVDFLGGAPGVHSARFAALADPHRTTNCPDADNNAKLLRLLATAPEGERTARFRCVLALVLLSGRVGSLGEAADETALRRQARLFEGTCEGRIGMEVRGSGGFGYDPLFFPTGYEQSFAELGEAVKNTISHRSRALAGLKAAFTT